MGHWEKEQIKALLRRVEALEAKEVRVDHTPEPPVAGTLPGPGSTPSIAVTIEEPDQPAQQRPTAESHPGRRAGD